MAYGYSAAMARLIEDKYAADPQNPIFILGALCVRNDITPSVVADKLGVSKQAVYDWFAEKYSPDPDNTDGIIKLTKQLKKQYKA